MGDQNSEFRKYKQSSWNLGKGLWKTFEGVLFFYFLFFFATLTLLLLHQATKNFAIKDFIKVLRESDTSKWVVELLEGIGGGELEIYQRESFKTTFAWCFVNLRESESCIWNTFLLFQGNTVSTQNEFENLSMELRFHP